MTREEVDKLLSNYKVGKARMIYLTVRLKALDREIEWARKRAEADLIYATREMDGMPHGNGISKRVENIAIKLADDEPMSDQEAELIRQRLKMIDDVDQLAEQKECVEAWVDGLTERERVIVISKYFDEKIWKDIVEDFKNAFGSEYSKNGLKRILSAALEKIYRMAE